MLIDSHRATPASEPAQLDLQIRDPEWRVRESVRARRLSVRVFHDGTVEVVAPRGTPGKRVQQFVAEHQRWIDRAKRRVTEHLQGQAPVHQEAIPSRLDLAAVNEIWMVSFQSAPSGARLRVVEEARPPAAGRLALRAAPDDAPAIQRAIAAWLKVRLARLAHAELPGLALAMHTDFSAVRVARQRTRWGSCSRRGHIGLNCCLLFQRPEVLRYLLVHELAHRIHMNHGRRFWALVERHEPDFRALDRELSQGWKRVPLWLLKRHAADRRGGP